MLERPAHPQPASASEVLALYAQGQRNFQNLELNAVNWAGVNLKGADFSYADFSEANLVGANLRGADLSYARFQDANLQDADLRGSSLVGADFRNANLQGTNLQEADYDPVTTHFPAGFNPQDSGLHPDR